MKFRVILSLLAVASSLALAETPKQILDTYTAQAVTEQASFKASAERGAAFFAKRFAVSEQMPACTSCHTDQPANAGKHVVTSKVIQPLSPSANAERLTDPAKVEKWFRRNCKEVLGRECTAPEKADFVAFLTGGR